nr:kinesin-like protein KIF26A [Paramormyrops kingsleyae]
MSRAERTSASSGNVSLGRDLDHRRFTVDGCPSRESPFALELSPRKRLPSAEGAQCGRRPPPEGAGAVTVSESGQFERREGKGNLCKQCQLKVTELKRQALSLADPGSLKDPGFATFLFDKLQAPEGFTGRHEDAARCQACATPPHQLRQRALQMVVALADDVPDLPPFSGLPGAAHGVLALPSAHDWPPPKAGTVLPAGDRCRGPGWRPGGIEGPKSAVLGSVTIQARQHLEGMWNISRVNNFLPQPGPSQGLTVEVGRESMCPEVISINGPVAPALLRSPPLRERTTPTPQTSTPSTSAAASFFIR